MKYALLIAACWTLAIAFAVGITLTDPGPAAPSPTLADVLGAPDDVFPGCLPIGSTEPSERTAVYASVPDTLVFVCTRR